MCEVRITDYLPEGWGGRVDFLCWDKEKRAFCLVDLKTTKGEGIKWIRNRPKQEHVWQLSAYYHALREARFPLLSTFTLFYLPMNNVMGENPEPLLIDCKPVPKETVWTVMEERWHRVLGYLDSIPAKSIDNHSSFVASTLADPIPRIQKIFRNKDKQEVRLVPHWSTMFCPYENDLCDCNTQGQTKIGEFVDGEYIPRKGFEQVLPTVRV